MDTNDSVTSESGTLSPATFAQRKRKRTPETGGQPGPTRELGLMRDVGKQDARFVGSGSGIYFIRQVYLRLARKSARQRTRTEAAKDYVPGEDDHSQGQNQEPLWRQGEISEGLRPVSFESFVDWSRTYFETWHPAVPFLNAPGVLETFEQVERSGIHSLSPADSLILRSLLSISLAESRQSVPLAGPIPSHLVFQSIDEALTAVQLVLRQPASMKGIQSALAVQLFLITMLRLNSASRLGGLITRIAFQLGLHRCPTRFPHFDPAHRQIRRRVFWAMFIMERFLSQSLGLPLDIRDDDVDVCFPGEEMHSLALPTANSKTKSTASAATEPDDKRLRVLRYVAKQARIRGMILELRNKSIHTRHDTTEEAEVVQAALAKWSNEIQDAIDEEEGPDSIPPGHQLLLQVLKQESLICLNRPLMASDPGSPSYDGALQNCIASAREILSCMKRHQNRFRIPGQEDNRLAVPIVWPSMTWAIWISSFILVYAAFEKQMPVASALRHIEQAKQILAHMALRHTSWPGYCLTAVEELGFALREVPAEGKQLEPQAGKVHTNSAVRKANQPRVNGSPRITTIPDLLSQSASDSHGLPSASSPAPRRPLPPLAPTTHMSPSSAAASQPIHDRNSVTNQPSPAVSVIGATATPQQQQPWSPTPFPSQPFTNFSPGNLEQTAGGTTDGVEESMAWYDQLFGETFNAMDYPFMAATQLDPGFDPRWEGSG